MRRIPGQHDSPTARIPRLRHPVRHGHEGDMRVVRKPQYGAAEGLGLVGGFGLELGQALAVAQRCVACAVPARYECEAPGRRVAGRGRNVVDGEDAEDAGGGDGHGELGVGGADEESLRGRVVGCDDVRVDDGHGLDVAAVVGEDGVTYGGARAIAANEGCAFGE